MGGSEKSEATRGGRRSKVSRLIQERGLQGLGAELEQLWTAEEDRRSLRDLAAYFNQRLLEQTLEEANVQLLDGEVENAYRLLTDDEVSSADSTRIKRRLERDGVDVESLLDDFVTYQAIRTYLKDYRGAEYSPTETDPLAREKTTIERLRGRTVSVTEAKLDQLRQSGELTLGDFRTLADVQVVCEDCHTQFDVVDLLGRGGCNCEDQ